MAGRIWFTKSQRKKIIPSWGYMIEHGATTIWELWNGNTADPTMNSGNHVMLVGDLVIWLYEDLAGIKSDPAAPGFKHIIMKPTPVGDLTFVKATHNSPYGLISSEWHRKTEINSTGRLKSRRTRRRRFLFRRAVCKMSKPTA